MAVLVSGATPVTWSNSYTTSVDATVAPLQSPGVTVLAW